MLYKNTGNDLTETFVLKVISEKQIIMAVMEKTIGWFEIPAIGLTRAKQFFGSVFEDNEENRLILNSNH